MQLRRVLGQAAVAHLRMPELALNDPKRMFDLGADAGLDVFELVEHSAHGRGFVQSFALARAHRHMPVGLDVLRLFSLAHALVARVGEHIALLAMHQRTGLRHVVDVGRCADDRVHQARVGVHPDVRLHAEVPLVALLRLMHLGVALAAAVLGRARRGNERGVHHGAALQEQSLGRERGVDRGQQLQAQLVALQQVAKAQDGALVGQVVLAHVQPGEFAKQRRVVQGFFHRRVRQVEPLLQEVNAQHRFDRKRRATAFGTGGRCVRRNQCHQLGPRHHQVHLVEELALARALGLALVSALAQAHLLHVGNVSHHAGGGRVVQTFPRCMRPKVTKTATAAFFSSRHSYTWLAAKAALLMRVLGRCAPIAPGGDDRWTASF